MASETGKLGTRKTPSDRSVYKVWAAAAGRCTFCNRSVLMNEDLGEAVPIGELAHIVGATEQSPRGASEVGRDARAEADNLILACRNCHKPVDDGGVAKRYSIEELQRRKREHEQRVYELTEIGTDRKATVLRVAGTIRGVAPELTRETVLGATTSSGLYPQRLPGSYWNVVDADLRQQMGESDQVYFQRAIPMIDELVARVHSGIGSDMISRLAVFGFARIPLLVYLGARLDDKVPTNIFQRHRVDKGNAWNWPVEPHAVPTFSTDTIRQGSQSDNVAIIFNLSGTIADKDLHHDIDDTYTVYAISSSPTGPSVISSPEALAAFEKELREFFAMVEANHGKLMTLCVFSAIPVSAAIVVGRVLMPNVSPALCIYDRDESGNFFRAMEVRK